jgi:hypothetical protein
MSRPTKAAKLRRPVAGSQIHMTCRVVGADRPQAAAPPVAGSCIFDPSLLLGDHVLYELESFVVIGKQVLWGWLPSQDPKQVTVIIRP